MPNVRIYVESRLIEKADVRVSVIAEDIRVQFSRAMHGRLENCHVMFTPAFGCDDQAPCYVDLDYRPTPERSTKAVTAACVELKLLLEKAFGISARIRAHPQDLATMTAVD